MLQVNKRRKKPANIKFLHACKGCEIVCSCGTSPLYLYWPNRTNEEKNKLQALQNRQMAKRIKSEEEEKLIRS